MRDLRTGRIDELDLEESWGLAAGKRSLTARIPGGGALDAPEVGEEATLHGAGLYQPIGGIQADGGDLGGPAPDPFSVHLVANRGVGGPAQTLPHLSAIQQSFGHHDVVGVRAHVGGDAATAAGALETRAFATGDDVAFAQSPDLRLAAHEAAHVVQQRGGVRLDGGLGRRGDEYERHADAVADLVVRGESAQGLLDTMAHRGVSGGAAVQRDDLPTRPSDITITPEHTGQVCAVWRGSVYDVNVNVGPLIRNDHMSRARDDISPGEGHYDSEGAAIAACNVIWHNAQAAAIFLQNGRYVAYWATANDPLYDFEWRNVRRAEGQPWTAIEFTGACRCIVLRDGVILRPSAYRAADAAAEAVDPSLMPGGVDLMPGYRDLYGDFSRMTQPEFIRMFGEAMRDNALTVLSRSQAEAETIKANYSSPVCTPESTEEWQQMETAARDIVAIDGEIAAARTELQAAEAWTPPESLPGGVPDPDAGVPEGLHPGAGGPRPDVEGVRTRLAEIEQRRRVAVLEYPILGHMDAEALSAFNALPLEQKITSLNGQLGSILEDVETTRNNIIDGTLDLWAIESMVNATIGALGVTDAEKRRWAVEEFQSQRRWNMIIQVGSAVLAVGLGLVATFATGGLALGAAAGALGLGAADAMMQTRDYFAMDAASNTDVNVDETIVPADLVSHWGWLVVAWVGVGLDALDVIRAVRAVKAAADAGVEMTQAIARGVDDLASATPEMAARLRAAAGQLDEVISEANKAALANRLGAPVEIVPELGAETRVYYTVNRTTKQITVTAIRCGDAARVAEVLAHENVVRLLTRYNGALGEMRRLWDRMLSFAGFTPTGCTHPAGSAAFESWHELQKLDEIVDARRADLSSAEALGSADEALIRRDVEFLEAERVRHAAVVDQMTLEAGAGYIARAEEQTRRAIRPVADGGAGLPDIFRHPMIADPTQYYYRVNPAGDPPFLLARISTEAAPPRTLVRNASGGWDIAEGALSRGEEASRMVEALSPELRRAYDAFKDAHGAARVVPLEGVAATGENLGGLIRNQGKWDEMRDLLETAFERSGHANPADAADAAMRNVDGHEIVVVHGTDQLRAFNYRLNFANETGAEAVNDLHHIIPLQLGGGHAALGMVDVHEDLHRLLHELIEGINFAPGVTLAPHSIRAGALDFAHGAAALNADGTVVLARLNPNGTFTPLP